MVRKISSMFMIIFLLLSGCQSSIKEDDSNKNETQVVISDAADSEVAKEKTVKDNTGVMKDLIKISYQDKQIGENHIFDIQPAENNSNILLVSFSTDNAVASDYHTCIYDLKVGKVLKYADEVTFSGEFYQTGWIDSDSFYLVNNYMFVIYGLDGQKKYIKRIENSHRASTGEAIHGAGLSQQGTMALFYCDGKTQDIQLLIYDNFSENPKNLRVVDSQKFRGGSECFPMQIIINCWDDSGKYLTYTTTFDRQANIINLTTDTTKQLNGFIGIQNISYDSAKQLFQFESQKDDQGRIVQYYNPINHENFDYGDELHFYMNDEKTNNNPTAMSVVKKYLEAMKENDYDTWLSTLTPEKQSGFSREMNGDFWVISLKTLNIHYETDTGYKHSILKSVKAKETGLTADNIAVVYTLFDVKHDNTKVPTPSGEIEWRFDLIREDNKSPWYIQGWGYGYGGI